MSKTNSKVRNNFPVVMSASQKKELSSLLRGPTLTNIRKKIGTGSLAAALAIEAAFQAGVRPSKLTKYQKALDLLEELTDGSLPGLTDSKATDEALAKRLSL